jgi:hypothetical protein
MAMKIGTRFQILGYAVRRETGRIEMIRTTRVKNEVASTVLATEWTGETFPNTAAGNRKAAASSELFNCSGAGVPINDDIVAAARV